MLAEKTKLAEKNKEVVRRWVEAAWSHGDFSEASSLYPSSYVLHNTSGMDVRGPEGLERFIGTFRAGLPDLRMDIEDMIAEGDKVAWRFTARATHTGELMGIPPTGRSATVVGIVLSRFESGLWVEDYSYSDDFGLMVQLGVIPAPPEEASATASGPGRESLRGSAGAGEQPMSGEEKKRLARIYWEEIMSDGRLDLADEIFAEDWSIHSPGDPESLRGPQGVKTQVRGYRSAFPDLRVTVQDQIAEGDRVVNLVTARGTHLGEMMGMPPTGKRVEFGGLAIDRLEGGKLAERWGTKDVVGLLRQLGVIPEPGK